MRWRNAWTVAGCTLAVVLAAGAQATANRPSDLREVQLGGDGWNVLYVTDMNRRGALLGMVADGSGGERIAVWRRYAHPVLIDPPDLRGAVGITDRGEVLGSYWYWRNGRTYYVTHPSRSLSLSDRNDRGEMTGTFHWTGTEPQTAFLWRNGTFTEIRPPQGMQAEALQLNNRGDVLGVVRDANTLPGPPLQAYVWRRGVMTVINLPGADDPESPGVYPRDINDRGQAIINGGSGGPYLWDRGRLIDLSGGRPSMAGSASDINNAGDVVGNAGGPVLWRNGRMIRLRLPAEKGWGAEAVAVNENGDVAGRLYHSRANSHTEVRAALWRNGRLLTSPGDLGEEISLFIAGIDDRARIGGYISNGATGDRSLVWTVAHRPDRRATSK